MAAKPTLILLRGPPGAGKTTLAEVGYPTFSRISADDYFLTNGSYAFDPRKLKVAHDICFARTKEALEAGKNVIVDNTNRRLDEFSRYLKLDAQIKIFKVVTQFKSNKNIPQHVITRYYQEYEAYSGERDVRLKDGIVEFRK